MTNRTSLIHFLLLLVGTCLLASIPVRGATCLQGSSEYDNIDKWKSSDGSWNMDKESDTPCYPPDSYCLSSLLILPKKFNLEKIFMYRGCNNAAYQEHIKKILQDNSGGISVMQSSQGRSSDEQEGCYLVTDPDRDLLMLLCLHKPENAPAKTGDKIEPACLTAFPKTIIDFRANPTDFPTKVPWKCGDVPHKPCDQGSNEWANIDEWEESGGSWDIMKVAFDMDDSDTCFVPSQPICIAALMLLPKQVSGDKILMYRGCTGPLYLELFVNLFVLKNLINGGGARSMTGGAGRSNNDETEKCGMVVSEGDDGKGTKMKMLTLACAFKPDAAPKKTGDKIDGKCLAAFHKDAKNFRANPDSFPVMEAWKCGDKVGSGGSGPPGPHRGPSNQPPLVPTKKTVFLITTLTCLVSYFWNEL